MRRIYVIKLVNGKAATMHVFEGKDALASYAANNGRGEATEGNPTISQLLNALGMTRVYARELSKYKKLNSQYHYN
jgi:hypothetical protein